MMKRTFPRSCLRQEDAGALGLTVADVTRLSISSIAEAAVAVINSRLFILFSSVSARHVTKAMLPSDEPSLDGKD